MRVGCGYDSHRFMEGRPLILGGVAIPFDRGLDGWSDADAVLHAVIDALCGAAGLGDIGTLFPSGDERFRDASSLALLRQVMDILWSRQLTICNVDVTILAEKPVMAPHIPRMRASVSSAMDLEDGKVSLKAKTNDHMGFVGRGEGIAAFAVVLIDSLQDVGP